MENAENLTIGYACISERRNKAVLIDFGEAKSVWLPLYRIVLNETDYTVSGPTDLLREKLEEARKTVAEEKVTDQKRISLPTPVWENDKAVGIDVIVSDLTGRIKVKKRLFFPKSQINIGTAPRWLVEKKQKEVLKDVAHLKKCSEHDLVIKKFTNKGLL